MIARVIFTIVAVSFYFVLLLMIYKLSGFEAMVISGFVMVIVNQFNGNWK